MKTRKLFLGLSLLVVLLLVSTLNVSAADKIIVNGGINNDLFGMGWEWVAANFSFDPVTYDADGLINYLAYEELYGKEYKLSWKGEVLCAAYGEYNGLPTVSIVTRIVSQKNIDPSWVGKYLKTVVSDGGQNASEDWIGIVAWNYGPVEYGPVSDMPACEFEVPGPYFPYYQSQNGNLTIHD